MRPFPFETRWASIVGQTYMPRGILGGVADGADIAARFSVEIVNSPWFAALFIRFALWLIWFAPVWMLGRPATFGHLAVPERCEILESMNKNRWYLVRQAVNFMKLIVCVLVLGDEQTLARVGAYRLREAPRSALRSLP